jgi:hypothetical protein
MRAFMLHDFSQVAAVDQVAAGRASLEMIGLNGRRPSIWLAELFP